MAQYGLSINIPKMKEDLLKYGIVYDQWFFESSLHESGYVAETVELLGQKGWTYEKDGALWLNTTQLLKEKYMREGKTQEQVDKLDLKDDVLRRANGFYTYFAADIAYHRNTCGAPTTTATWPGSRPPWTAWVWTARTGWWWCSCSW